MTETITLQTAVDVYVTPTTPARVGVARLYVNSTAQAYMFFNMPVMPPNAVIISATLDLYAGTELAALTSGFPTITAHTVSGVYDANTLTWLTKPAESAAVETKTAPVTAGQPLWQFDLTPEVANAVATGVWYGITLKGNGAATHYFWSSRSSAPAVMRIVWTAPPPAPTGLNPANGLTVNSSKPVLTWNGLGGSGGERPYAFQVQVATNLAMTTGLFDTGEVVSTSNMLDLSTTAFTAITSGQTRYWRVRTKNTSGYWGPYSAVSSFAYVVPGTLTITGPAVSMSNPAPIVTWTFTGATQQAFQVIIKNTLGKIVHDSGIVNGTALSYQTPQGIWKNTNDAYTIELRVWDNVTRIGVSGITNWRTATRTVTYVPGGTPPPVQLQVTDWLAGYPHQYVRWQYTSPTPTEFVVIRYSYPGDPSPRVTWHDPAVVAQPGQPQWYHLHDMYVAPRNDVTWVVRAVLNGVVSNNELSVTKAVKILHPWLVSTIDSSKRIGLVNCDVDPGMSEVSDVVSPIGGVPFLVTQQLKGYMGSATGRIANGVVDGLTARTMKETFFWLRSNPRCWFTWADEAIECFIFNTKIRPIPTSDGSTDYTVSFDFIEQQRAS